MLFDIEPKSARKDFFDREDELKQLTKAVERERFIVIQGIRRLGKSSLLNVALAELKHPFFKLDLREIFFDQGSLSKYHFYNALSNELSRLNKVYRLSQLLKRIKGVRVGDLEVQLDWRKEGVLLTELFRRLDEWAEAKGQRFVVAFDEAQYLRFSGRTRYQDIIAWAIDNLSKIIFVLTGSEVGVLQDFLGNENPKSALYGRYSRKIVLSRVGREKSREFLEKGFAEAGRKPPELEVVLDRLDGLIGWLTLYGHTVISEGKADVGKFVKSAGKLVRSEMEKITRWSDRYMLVLSAAARGAKRWSEIYNSIVMKMGPIPKSDVAFLLERLVGYGYLERDQDGSYFIPDPVVAYAAEA